MRVSSARLVVLVAVTACPRWAWADDASADATRIRAASAEYDAGRRAYKGGDFQNAGDHFENANRDAPAPEALRGAIKSRAAAKQDARAATLAAIADVKYPTDKATKAVVTQTLGALEKSLHRVSVHCSTPCTVLVDGKLSPWLETSEAVVYTDPGTHKVLASFGERQSKSADVVATAGGHSQLSFDPPPPEPIAPTKPSDKPPSTTEPDKVADPKFTLPRPVFYVAAGTTVVFTGLTVWSAIAMRSSPGKQKVRDDCAGQPTSCPTYQDALSAQRRTNILGVVSGVGLAATAVVGLFFTDWGSAPKPTEARAPRFVPYANTDRGVTVGALGTF